MNILKTIQTMREKKVLVMGDAMVDAYVQGASHRLCPEAPVPIVDIDTTLSMPGGAGNTANNVAALEAQTYFLSVVGTDEAGQTLQDLLKQQQIQTNWMIQDPSRKTMIKTRVLADSQILVRFDSGSTKALSPATEEQLLEKLIDLYYLVDVIIISDYGYGVITPKVIETLQKLKRTTDKIVTVDSKYPDAFAALQPTLVKPNYKQVLQFLGITRPQYGDARIDQIEAYRDTIGEKTGAAIVAVTLDRDGALIFEHGKPSYRTYTTSVENARTSGAGDTYVSAFTLALALGMDTQSAAEIAAAAAEVSIHKQGTANCTLSELTAQINGQSKYIANYEQLQNSIEEYKKLGKRIVFTNGCFDILHSGHVTYLNKAKKLGDILIVGLNTDDSIKRQKGNDRPINTLEDRIAVIAGLSSVDHIVSFSQDLPNELIQIVRPDIHVKGGDYKPSDMPEAPLVERLGGKVVIIPLVQERSTTNIIQKIQQTPHFSSHA